MRTRPTILLMSLALLVMGGWISSAGAQPMAQPPAVPRPPSGPVRDAGGRPAPGTTAPGTGAITGTITLAAGVPAAGARVMLSGGDGPPRTKVTDNQGRFAFDGIRAGRYGVNVSKPGFVSISYGQRRANSAGTTIPLADGERRDIAILLPRGGVITGTVLDERGEPAINASVRAMRYTMVSGRRRTQQTSGGQTDDRGIYRLHSLTPGEYAVCALFRDTGMMTDAQRLTIDIESLSRTLENMPAGPARVQMTQRLAQLRAQKIESNEPAMGYAPSCFPASSPSPSATIVMAAGEERSGIDIQLALTHVARVEGTLVGAPDGQLGNLQISMVNADEAMSSVERPGARVEPNGRFSFQDVAPGRYTLVARSMFMGMRPPMVPGAAPSPPKEEPRLWGTAEVNVAGQDIADVVIELTRGITISGQLVFQPTTLTPPGDLSRSQVSVFPATSQDGELVFSMGPPPQAKVDSAGRFTIPDVVPGKYRLSAGLMGTPGWVVDTITAGGQDVLDFPLEVRPGRDISGVVVTFGDRVTELSGTIADAKGRPATEETILLYPTDQKYWTPQSRRIRIVRASDDGQYSFRMVPPGEYRLTTLVDPEPGSWFDRELLEQLDATSVRVVLTEGEKRVEHLKIR